MKILVVGGGGREHAIVWKLSKSKKVTEIFCAPGNGGISEIANCVPLSAEDIEGLLRFSKKEKIDLAVIGPENPLASGIVDTFLENGIPAFGPRKKAALIETSKVFAKRIMKKYGIPTADFEVFEDYGKAIAHVSGREIPFVVKADGLCGGKGAYVIRRKEEAYSVLEDLFVKKVHGIAGERVIVEDCLTGQEISYLAFCDGKTFLPLIPSQDHKALLDNDMGPMTGGMGAYAPVPFVSNELEENIKAKIMGKTLEALREEGVEYKGILYGGLMLVGEKPYVLEFNARFGDPETQAILVKMDSDLLPIISSCVNGTLHEIGEIKWKEGYAVCVVVASRGYPWKPEKDKPIEGLDFLRDLDDVIVFHAGTKKVGDRYYTSGGRVLNIVAIGKELQDTIEKVYDAISMINFEGMFFRKDIGKKALDYIRRIDNG